jgi:Cys-rich repeat protein
MKPSSPRSPARLLVAAIPFALAVAGCGAPMDTTTPETLVCDPPCPKSQTCTKDGCIAPGGMKPVDMAAPQPDIAADCVPACGGATPFCKGGVCVPCLADKDCPAGQVCRALGETSACVPGCADDTRCGGGAMKCCGGGCVDTSKDARNCGACGMACGVQHSTAFCNAGACTPGMCTAGWADCNKDPADGCEAKLDYDVANCGACGAKCAIPNAIQGCGPAPMGKSGCYLKACLYGFDDCDGSPDNGCEKDITSDVKNCGACGMACGNVGHGKIGCITGVCALTSCDQGWSDCDNNPKNGCETATGTDKNNCGKCGNACGQGQVCVNSSCTCANCSFNNAKSKCVNNVCQFDVCLPNFGDCDFNVNNGCEVDLTGDNNNCGACGAACGGQTPYCVAGKCTNVSKSCLDYFNGGQKNDGMYTIDPDLNGPLPPVQVYCDMANGGQTVWNVVHDWGEWGAGMNIVMRDGNNNAVGSINEWQNNCKIFGKNNYAGSWHNHGGTYSDRNYRVFNDSQDWWNNFALKVFPSATYDKILILQDSNSTSCWAWYAEAGSLQSFGSPVGNGYAFCRGGNNASERYHIYLCLP